LGLQEKVRVEHLAEQQRRNTIHQAAKKEQTKSQPQPIATLPKEEDEVNLKKLQSIKNAIDAIDKSLNR